MNAAKPDQAVLLYEKWNELLREKGQSGNRNIRSHDGCSADEFRADYIDYGF